MLKLVAMLSLAGTVLGQLRCYDCDPSAADQCRQPEQNNIQASTCQTLTRSTKHCFLWWCDDNNADNPPATFECISLYFKSGSVSDKEGVYRGCVQLSGNSTGCDVARSQAGDGMVTECQSCATDLCNRQHVNGAGAALSGPALMAAVVIGAYSYQFQI